MTPFVPRFLRARVVNNEGRRYVQPAISQVAHSVSDEHNRHETLCRTSPRVVFERNFHYLRYAFSNIKLA